MSATLNGTIVLVGMLFFLSSLKKEIIMNQDFLRCHHGKSVIAAVKEKMVALNCMQKI